MGASPARQEWESSSADDNNQQKALLDPVMARLTKLGKPGYAVRGEPGEYRLSQFDTDTDWLANFVQADKRFN